MPNLKKEYTGHAGGIPGLVRITINASGRATRVEIDDLIFNKEDKDLISKLFVVALNDAYDQADEDLKTNLIDKMKDVYGGNEGIKIMNLSDFVKPPNNGEGN